MTSPRRAAVLGGNRIPFARQFGAYAEASNQDMLTAALEGLVARHGLAGERVGEVVAGAVIKHSRDFNLTREAVLGSSLSPTTPAYDITQACGTGLEAAILVANKIALGQVDSGIAGGVDSASDAPVVVHREAAPQAAAAQPRQELDRAAKAALAFRPGPIVPAVPANTEPRTGLSMGEHMAITAARWGVTREDQDELPGLASHHNLAAAYDRGFFDDLLTPYLGLTRDQNLRARLHAREARLAQARVRRGRGGDDDRRQLHAAHRRRLRGAARLARSGPPRTGCRPWPGSSTARRPRSTTCTVTRGC